MELNDLKNDLAREEKRLNSAYYYLGREYVKLLNAGAAPAIPGLSYLLGKAAEFQSNIDGINAQLNAPAPAPAPAAAPAAAAAGKFCTSCGAALDADALFCTECGAKQG